MKLESKELMLVTGGATTATWINAVARAANAIMDFGRTVGTAIRRIWTRNYC